jgi:hypothetical protein
LSCGKQELKTSHSQIVRIEGTTTHAAAISNRFSASGVKGKPRWAVSSPKKINYDPLKLWSQYLDV